MAKKKFFETVVGASLKTVASIVAPNLVKALEGVGSVKDALAIVRESGESPEVKAQLQEFTLKQYELEVEDRISARSREAAVLQAGGSDVLFKTVGWGITLAFLLIVLYSIGIIPADPDINKDFLMFASGSVTSAFMAVISYYFGSSTGSKQKTNMMNK